jgi:hypothetical protein
MRIRLVASLLLGLAGAVVLTVSLRARAVEIRHRVLESAAAVGTPVVSPRTPADAYLAALAAFRTRQKHAAVKAAGPRAAMIATVEQAIREALAAGQPAAQRSQLENLAGALEQELAGLGGDQASAHKRAAAHWLQRAVVADDTNADAKYYLELLISQDPTSAQKQLQPAAGQKNRTAPEGKRRKKSNAPKARPLGTGF